MVVRRSASAVALALALGTGLAGCASATVEQGTAPGVVPVVAAESMWGSLVSQVGGPDIQVTTIVTDPNADPHDHESTAADARQVATARLVVLNGAGYDSWMTRLLAPAAAGKRTVLNVADLVGVPTGANPHIWYDPHVVITAVMAMTADLCAIDPGATQGFLARERTLVAGINAYRRVIARVAAVAAGRPVAATETVAAPLAAAMHLSLVSPDAFMSAVAEGNDPPTQSLVTFTHLLAGRRADLLIVNTQTQTPLTTLVAADAASVGIPVVGITETLSPIGTPFQVWMGDEVRAVAADLGVIGA